MKSKMKLLTEKTYDWLAGAELLPPPQAKAPMMKKSQTNVIIIGLDIVVFNFCVRLEVFNQSQTEISQLKFKNDFKKISCHRIFFVITIM